MFSKVNQEQLLHTFNLQFTHLGTADGTNLLQVSILNFATIIHSIDLQ